MSSTRHLVSIPLGDNTLYVDCWYTKGKRSNNYDEPDEPDEIEIECIKIGQEDVTEMMATLWAEKRGTITRDIRYVPVWEILEQKCLEGIYEQER